LQISTKHEAQQGVALYLQVFDAFSLTVKESPTLFQIILKRTSTGSSIWSKSKTTNQSIDGKVRRIPELAGFLLREL